MPPIPETHSDLRFLGDGVYASFDGWQIWLWTQRGETWHYIALEPELFAALNQYRNWLDAHQRTSAK